jgi:hypothetical protein
VKEVGGADVRLERVLDDGKWYLLGYEHLYTVNNCMIRYWREARARGQLSREAAPAAAPSDPLSPPRWNIGDEWAFSTQSQSGTGTFVWSVIREDRAEGSDYYVLKSGAQSEAFFRKSDLAWYQDRNAGVLQARANPPQLRYAWPLVVGREWEQTVTVESGVGRSTGTTIRACRIETEETVSVPAGTFRAFKTVCRNKATGDVIHQTWFAPAVKMWVKEWSSFPWGIQERELIGVKFGQGK